MKKIGIIGGLGPETTTRFYMEVILGCSKISKVRPSLIISNVALPLKIEEEVIVNDKGEKRLLPFLLASAKELEKSGVDSIVIPCNTVHQFIKEIRRSVKIPVISIIEETKKFFLNKKITNLGLLATTSTIKNKLFDDTLESVGIQIQTPEKNDQIKLGKIIHKIVRDTHSKDDKKNLLGIITRMKKRNVDTFLLACTDLQILINSSREKRIFDTMEILTRATVREALS